MWKALKGLADDRSIVIRQAVKCHCMVVWHRCDCIKEANKQLKDKTVHKDINFEETTLSDVVHKSNRIFKSLYTRKFVSEKELKLLQKKWSFPIRISSVNVTKSAVRIWSHLLKKSLMKNFIFCAVNIFPMISKNQLI